MRKEKNQTKILAVYMVSRALTKVNRYFYNFMHFCNIPEDRTKGNMCKQLGVRFQLKVSVTSQLIYKLWKSKFKWNVI